MAIQPETGVGNGASGGPRWDEVFTPSDLAEGVFDVRWDLRPRLRRWLAEQDLATASGRETHRPAIDAWALLDGGVIAVSAVSLPGVPPRAVPLPGQEPAAGTTPPRNSALLSPGMRLIGHRTLRLVVARLGLPGGDEPLPGEHRDVPGLVEDLFDARRRDAESIEQAELLATCTDRTSLRWVVAALRP